MSDRKQAGDRSNEQKQDAYLLANLANICTSATMDECTGFTDFLDLRQQSLVLAYVKKLGTLNYIFFGGNSDCERRMFGVFPNSTEVDINDFPIVSIRFALGRHTAITHRDCLGAMMALQIKRNCIGDIFLNDNEVLIFVADKIADFLLLNLTQIGKFTVEPSISKEIAFERKQEYLMLEGTVASYRLDCIMAFLLSTGRAAAVAAIESKIVYVNNLMINNCSHKANSGDVVVIRGTGKFIIGGDCRITKKNRFHITVKKLV